MVSEVTKVKFDFQSITQNISELSTETWYIHLSMVSISDFGVSESKKVKKSLDTIKFSITISATKLKLGTETHLKSSNKILKSAGIWNFPCSFYTSYLG